MSSERTDTLRLRKVAVTKKVEDSEKQMIVGETKHGQAPLVEGEFLSHNVAKDINIHGCRSRELHSSNVVSTAPSSVTMTILLEGELNYSYDDLEFNLNASSGGKVTLVNLNQPSNFRRAITEGNQVTKLNVLINHDWVKLRTNGHCKISQFIANHKNFLRFDCTPELKSLVFRAIKLYQANTFLEKITLDSIAFQMLEIAFNRLQEDGFQTKASRSDYNTSSSVEDIICFIESNLSTTLAVNTIADHFAMSSSNLQRRFKQSLGITVNGFIRRRRLDVARQHLERGLVSITEAAYEAGYNHPANFTNAFKKEYGIPPISVLVNTPSNQVEPLTNKEHQVSNIYSSYEQ